MNADKWTDKALERLEKRIAREYKIAGQELKETADKYFNGWDEFTDGKLVHHKGMTERLAQEEKAYKAGKYTDAQWKAYQLSQMGRGQHWISLKEQMTERMAQAQSIAQGYANDILPSVFAKNSNGIASIAQASAMEQGVTGISFELVDEHTVKLMMEGAREVLPFKPIAIDLPRVNDWNMTNIQNALLQGIVQGDSIGKIADRFERVANMNRTQSIRSARTAVTGAQSAGKQDRFEKLKAQGCEMTKIWVATHDERTRPEHAEANGQEVGIDEPFDVGGEELMYPADMSGSGWNIYNCRCTMKTGKIKFKSVLSDGMRQKANIRMPESKTTGKPFAYQPIDGETSSVKYSNDIKEAEVHALRFADSASYYGIELEHANRVNETLTKLTEKYPTKKLKEISSITNANAGEGSYKLIHLNGEEIGRQDAGEVLKDIQSKALEQMLFVKKNAKDPMLDASGVEETLTELRRIMSFKRYGIVQSYPSQTVEVITTHEYGHVIADQYFGQIFKEEANPHYYTNPKIKKLVSAWEEAYNKAIDNGDIVNISYYSYRDAQEFFAETFCAYEMGEALPLYIRSLLEETLRDGIL